MKKLLFSAAICASTFSYAQFETTGSNTGLSYAGGAQETANVASWETQVPKSSDINCTSPATGTVTPTAGTSMNFTFANALSGYTRFTPGGECVEDSPLFAVNLANPINLSAAENKKLSIAISSSTAFLLLVNVSNGTTVLLPKPLEIAVRGGNERIVYPVQFLEPLNSTADLSSIKKILFIHQTYGENKPLNATVSVSGLSVGSAQMLTGIAASHYVANSSLFPNPADAATTATFNLMESSNVKVTLSDLSGQVMQVISNGNMTAGSQQLDFNVTGLAKGMYCVNYYVNGAAAGIQKLIVK